MLYDLAGCKRIKLKGLLRFPTRIEIKIVGKLKRDIKDIKYNLTVF